MAPTVEWPGSGAVVELDLWPADIVYADEAGVCGGYPACYERVQTAVDTVLADGRVYVYTGTYTDTTLHRSVEVTALGSITLTNVTILTGALSAPPEKLSLSGAMTYTDGTFNHRNGTVAFIGTSTQTIAGSVAFYDVVVSGTATVTTQSDVTVTGVCTHELGSVTEETKGVSGTDPIAFPLAGMTITPTVAGDLAGLRVRRVEEDHPQAPPGSEVETGRYWRIEPTAGSVYSATLTLPHPTPPDANDQICRYDGTWDCAVHSYSATDQTITRMYIDHFSDWMTGEDMPTAVDLVTLIAVPGCNEVVVRWETASEVDNLGFNLYRSQSPDGIYTKLNGALIPSQSPGSPFGAVYTWHDREARPGALYYKLEDVDVDGRRTWHGPVALDPSQALGCHVYLPLAVRSANAP
jgi:hypothetical protein